jgi:hypothetical protein
MCQVDGGRELFGGTWAYFLVGIFGLLRAMGGLKITGKVEPLSFQRNHGKSVEFKT